MTKKGGSGIKNIWVLPEITNADEDASKLSLGLLTEAGSLAEKTGGAVTAIAFGDRFEDYSEVLGRYGVSRAYYFIDPLLQYFSAEAGAAAVLASIREEKPWLFLLGDTAVGRELAPRLAALLNTGLVTDCVRIDLSEPEKPRFYRPVYAGQLYQEVILEAGRTMLVTMDPGALDVKPAAVAMAVDTQVFETKLSPESIKTRHLEYLPADFQTVDVADAETIVAAGMGAIDPDLFPLVEELAALLQGAIGTTRPVVDGGKIPRERLIGQTGKVVGPDFYLALGISGASHHVGGIQDSGKIVAINRDPQAPIFQNADAGAVADLREVLPKLIARIKRAKTDGEIL
jgi:electron transfer flavoprotein alpha subunit